MVNGILEDMAGHNHSDVELAGWKRWLSRQNKESVSSIYDARIGSKAGTEVRM